MIMLRCPECNSTAVRKREMIVKAGTYIRVGGSTGLSSKSSTRVFASWGRNNWVDELTPMSYVWPIVLAVFLVALFREYSTSFGYWATVLFNVMWLMVVHSDHKGFREEWACSKCGEVWNPSEPKQVDGEGHNSTKFRGA
jgi:hypothetical protein